MSVGNRLRTLFRFFLMLTVLAAVALVSAITTIRLTIRGRQAAAPDLTGVPVEQAERKLGDLGLGLQVEDKLYSSYPANQIVSQVPASGTSMKVGQHLHVLVSLGPMRAAIPELVGSSLRAARIVAIQRGLTVGDVASVHSPGTMPDQIVAQDPPAESATAHTPAVDLLVSLGETPASYVCPNFVGIAVSRAREQLQEAGLQVGTVTPVEGAMRPPNTIVGQTPLAGSKISPDTVFNFQVAQ